MSVNTPSAGTAAAGASPRASRSIPALPRDLAASGAVLGIASGAWFAWGSSGAPQLRPWFLAGIVIGLVLGAIALLLRRRMSGVGSHQGPCRAEVQRTYNRALLAEVILIVAGNTVLGLTGLAEYVSCWTYVIMSLHFLPLGRVYRIPALRVTAWVGVVIALSSAVLGATTALSPIAVTGGVGALALVVSGALQLRQARTADGDDR